MAYWRLAEFSHVDFQLFLNSKPMTTSFSIKLYLLTVPVFFLIDMLWLGVIARNFYQNSLGSIIGPGVNWPAAIIFYLISIVGILIFAVAPALAAQSFDKAALWGALFGFFTYSTYDLTNLATIEAWPLKFAVVDILWGTVLCALVAVSSFFIGQWLR